MKSLADGFFGNQKVGNLWYSLFLERKKLTIYVGFMAETRLGIYGILGSLKTHKVFLEHTVFTNKQTLMRKKAGTL
jgi:hypothetical protein